MNGLIEEYKMLAAVCFTTDYADKASVKKHNRTVQRMYEIVEAVGTTQVPETLDQLAELLDMEENQTNLWAAGQMLDRRKVDPATEEKALNIIRRAASGTDGNALGYRHWLKVWNEKNEPRI